MKRLQQFVENEFILLKEEEDHIKSLLENVFVVDRMRKKYSLLFFKDIEKYISKINMLRLSIVTNDLRMSRHGIKFGELNKYNDVYVHFYDFNKLNRKKINWDYLQELDDYLLIKTSNYFRA